jgi:hypothetical protein
MKLGQKVFIPELNQFGTIEEIRENRITKVKIGNKIIDVIDLIVTNWTLIKEIILFLSNIFKKKT